MNVAPTEEQLHELRVNTIIRTFVNQRDTALSNVASLSADKAALESRNQFLVAQVNELHNMFVEQQALNKQLTDNVNALSGEKEQLMVERTQLTAELARITAEWQQLLSDSDSYSDVE